MAKLAANLSMMFTELPFLDRFAAAGDAGFRAVEFLFPYEAPAETVAARAAAGVYHMQIMEGDLARTIARLLPQIGHMQLADNPGRNEPGTGEIAYPRLLERIDTLGYLGWIGCEYRLAAATIEGLSWACPYLG